MGWDSLWFPQGASSRWRCCVIRVVVVDCVEITSQGSEKQLPPKWVDGRDICSPETYKKEARHAVCVCRGQGIGEKLSIPGLSRVTLFRCALKTYSSTPRRECVPRLFG